MTAIKFPVSISMDKETLSKIDADRGDVSRSRWFERLVDEYLNKAARA